MPEAGFVSTLPIRNGNWFRIIAICLASSHREYLTYKEWKRVGLTQEDLIKVDGQRLCEYLTYKEWKPYSIEVSTCIVPMFQ